MDSTRRPSNSSVKSSSSKKMEQESSAKKLSIPDENSDVNKSLDQDESEMDPTERDFRREIEQLKQNGVTISQHLIALCKRGDWLGVDTLLRLTEPQELNLSEVAQGSGWSPLMFATKENRVNIVERLIEVGFDVNAQATDGITALHLACAYAREDTIRCLLVRKANPMIAGGPKMQLPIHILALKPTMTATIGLQLILRSSPKEVRITPDKDGNIPLFLSLENGNNSITRELLLSMAKEQVSMKRPPMDDTVVHIVCRRKDMDMLKNLIELGANINDVNANGQTVMHIVCETGDETMLKFLHSLGANANLLDKDEKTPLHIATEKGHYKIVDLLIEKFKVPVLNRTRDGNTLMHIASKSGPPEMALIFLKKGVPLHMPNKKGAKAIHMAAMAGHADVVKSIIQKGENVDCKTNDGYTALHLAVESGQSDIVEALLGYGSNVHLKTEHTGETPLHIAARVEHGKTCAELLIKSGADVNALQQDMETPLHIAARFGFQNTVIALLEDGATVDLQNSLGENVLHICIKESHFSICQQIINVLNERKGKDLVEKLINQPNKQGETSVHYAAIISKEKKKYENEDKDIMKLLIQNAGDISIGTFETQETPLHYCSKSGNINVLKEIISQLQPIDAQVACNKQAKNGWSPLLYACHHGHPEIIRILLNQNARVDVFDERGRAGLHLAAKLGHEDVCDILLEHNAFVNVRNKIGMTPLHLAAKMGFKGLVQNLVSEHGALLDAMTLSKQTSLHLAAENGQFDVVKVLLDMKADINAMDNQAQTPLHLAAQSDHPEVLKLFLHHKPELLSISNKNGYTCAHIAATKGSVAVLKELMKFNQEAVRTARIRKTGSTALHLAAEGGHVKVVKLLLQAGAKASDENLDGQTPLHLAAQQGHIRVLQTLKGALDWKVCSRKSGLSALHVASSCGQVECVSELLTEIPAGVKSERSLADPSADYGITPLHLASQYGHEGVVRLLMNSPGVQVDAPTAVNGTIPMHLAAQGGHMLVAGLLISRSADSLIQKDKQGRTAVHLASAHGHVDMVGLLLGQGAEINAQDKKQWTPLHYASRYGYIKVVILLTESGADPCAQSKEEKIPLCCAAQAGHYEVLSYLLKKEHDTIQLIEDKAFLMDMMNCSKNNDNKPIQEFILVSEAPIYTAVKLARCYESLQAREKERFKDLDSIKKFCDQIAIDLLSIAASTSNSGHLLRAFDHRNIEFLDVLIELERKEVVSQHAVQKYLTDVWMGNLQWSNSSFILLFFVFLICPLVWIAVSCPIGHKLHKIPIIKFMSYLSSHIFFIMCLTFTIVFPPTKLYEYDHCIPLWNEWVLFLWLIGILVSDLMNPSDRSGLGVIKVCIQYVGFLAMIVHFLAFIFYTFIVNTEDLSWSKYRLDTLYGRNQLLAVAMLLSFIEFLNFLTFHPLFGPWGVIIQELIQDLMRFLALLSIFLAGFTLHICAIYQPVYENPNYWNNTIPPLGQEFIVPHKSFEMLFYALFGLVEPDNMPPMHLSPGFSKLIIKMVFGVYMTVTLIVLINLLIAMMSNTYQRIEAQSDIEWKFGRAKLIRNMNRTLSTPSPINLFIGIPVLHAQTFLKKLEQDKLEHSFAKNAFGQLASDQSAVAKQWMDRRMSRASKMSKVSRGTQNTNQMGNSILEANLVESKPINTVVNWQLIVKKYWESIGVSQSGNGSIEDEGNEKSNEDANEGEMNKKEDN